MADSGLYNYIKNELAQGKTKEQVGVTLMQDGGWTQTDIDTAFFNIQNGIAPKIETIIVQKPINKAKISLLIALLSLFLCAIMPILGGSFIELYSLLVTSIYIGTAIAIAGIIYTIFNFKSHKIISIIAIILCLLSISQGYMMFKFQYLTGQIGNHTYENLDFTIQIPRGWSEIKPSTEAPSIKVAFAPNHDTDIYRARLFVSSAPNQMNLDLETFGEARIEAIKADSSLTFISGRKQTYIKPAGTEKEFYLIQYNLVVENIKILDIELLEVTKSTTYIVSAILEESTYINSYKNKSDNTLLTSLLSFTTK